MAACASPPSTAEARIELFARLFRCREDVYPKYWENSRSGRKGYAPACENEWISGLCNKKAVKCAECTNRAFRPLDDKAVRSHLEGRSTIGTYAIRRDDTCVFLAADFDEGEWREDALAYRDAAARIGVEVGIERSRSGDGAHVWVFFNEAVPAWRARCLGSIILSLAMAQRQAITFSSYDRFFPSQDCLPAGGFGNLIALPLQRGPRARGNSVFVDENFAPHPDQWAFLSRLHLMTADELKRVVEENVAATASAATGQKSDIERAESCLDVPHASAAVAFGGEVTVTLSKGLAVETEGLPSGLIARLKRLATFANPKYFEAQRLRFSTWKIPRYICCADLEGGNVLLPRGLLAACTNAIAEAGAAARLVDIRVSHGKKRLSFKGSLRKDQGEAVDALVKAGSGVLVAPPGSGKTVIACGLIAKHKLPTLILVHRKQLAEQWRSRLLEFLGLDKKKVGTLAQGGKRATRVVDIAMIQTLARGKGLGDIVDYGLVVIDECHHVPAVSFESVLKRMSASHIVGLTATPFRQDGLQAIVHMHCGPIAHTMTEAQGQADMVKRVVVRETAFQPVATGAQTPIHEVWEALVADGDRLRLVTYDVVDCLRRGDFPLILSDRVDHLQLLLGEIAQCLGCSDRGFLLTSHMGKKMRKKAFERIHEMLQRGETPFLLSTGSLIGEGFDLPELTALFLAMPIAFRGRLIQYAGRIHRQSDGKSEVVVFDYVDSSFGLGVSMFRKRVGAYRKMGYEFDLPDSSKLASIVWPRGKTRTEPSAGQQEDLPLFG